LRPAGDRGLEVLLGRIHDAEVSSDVQLGCGDQQLNDG
jgi:hypothetical protein